MFQNLTLKPGANEYDLRYSSFNFPGQNTVQKLIHILSSSSTAPITENSVVGALVPSLDELGATINHTWNLPDGYGYRTGDILAAWTVAYLAADIDNRLASV